MLDESSVRNGPILKFDVVTALHQMTSSNEMMMSSPCDVGEHEKPNGQNMVEHQNKEVFPDCFEVDGGIGAVEVKTNLYHIQPV